MIMNYLLGLNMVFILFKLSRNTKDILQIYDILKNNNISLMSVERNQLVEIKHKDVMQAVKISCIISEEIKETINLEMERLKDS